VQASEFVIELAFMRARLQERKLRAENRAETARHEPTKWATRYYALGQAEAFTIAIATVDEVVGRIERT
jgi:hypothetical protein